MSVGTCRGSREARVLSCGVARFRREDWAEGGAPASIMPTDQLIQQRLEAHPVAQAQALQLESGKLRRASGHFGGRLLAFDPHHLRSHTRRPNASLRVALLLLAAVCGWVWFRAPFSRSRTGPAAVESTAEPEGTNRGTGPQAVRRDDPPMARSPASDELRLLAGAANLPEAVRQPLRVAVRSFGFVETEKRRLGSGTFGYSVLHGMQRKLFYDDYAVACAICGQLRKDAAGLFYSNLLSGFSRLSDGELAAMGFDQERKASEEAK